MLGVLFDSYLIARKVESAELQEDSVVLIFRITAKLAKVHAGSDFDLVIKKLEQSEKKND